MRIGIDVESGETPFQELIKGSLNSIQSIPDISIFIIGNVNKIKSSFPSIEKFPNLKLVNAKEIVKMNENPIAALKKKKDSTIMVGINLLKTNQIDAFFSPGNTGATVAAGVLNLGMINGIKKPAMATFFPRNKGGETLILDIGANPDGTIENLYHNAILGLAYYKIIWGKEAAKVGLLNIGGESIKGTKIIKKAYEHLQAVKSFIGNVEGYRIFDGSVDVIICNGFTGNSILKLAEALKIYFISIFNKTFNAKNISKNLKKIETLDNNQFLINRLKKIKILKKLQPKFFGAAPLLGINGIVLVGHGNCTGIDLENAVLLANHLHKLNYINELIKTVKNLIKKD